MAGNKDSDNAKSISIAEWQEIFGTIDNDEEFDENSGKMMLKILYEDCDRHT